MKKEDGVVDSRKFVPKGAMAFFGVLLLTMASIWLGIYFLMIKQS